MRIFNIGIAFLLGAAAGVAYAHTQKPAEGTVFARLAIDGEWVGYAVTGEPGAIYTNTYRLPAGKREISCEASVSR